MPKSLNVLASQLKSNTTACRVSFSWFGVRKSLTEVQKSKAAQPFDADQKYLGATQKLLDTRHPKYAALTALKNTIVSYWKGCTLPYVDDGVRLLSKEKVPAFNEQMEAFKQSFLEGVTELNDSLYEIKMNAMKKLGSLYSDDNYPESLNSHFALEWSFPSIDPPEYLATLSPKVYEQEKQKIQDQLKSAVRLAEEAFTVEFAKLVSHLSEKLSPSPDGKKKVLHETTVTNIHDFIIKFEAMSLGSNDDLEKLVKQTKELIFGVKAEELRDLETLKKQVSSGLEDISKKLEPMISNKPRRKIITPNISNTQNKEENIGTQPIPA